MNLQALIQSALDLEAQTLGEIGGEIKLFSDGVQVIYADNPTDPSNPYPCRSKVLSNTEKMTNVKIEETATAYRFYVPVAQSPDPALPLTIQASGDLDQRAVQLVEILPNPTVPAERVVTVQRLADA